MSDTIKYRSLHIFDKMFFKGGIFRRREVRETGVYTRYSNSAIKREQSQIYLNFAEREQNRH